MATVSRERSRWTGGPRWPIAAAIVLWSAFSFLVLLFDPGSDVFWRSFNQPPLTCARFIGRSAQCDAAVNAANAAWQWLHVYPLLLFVAAGYVAIVLVALLGHRARTR